jgi:hypothetical protein
MKKPYRIEVFADERCLLVEQPVVHATNHGTALLAAYKLVKSRMRRGTKKVSIRATKI